MSARILMTSAAFCTTALLFVAHPYVAMAGDQPPPAGGGSDNFGVQQGTSGTEINGSDITVNAGLSQGVGGGPSPGATVTTSSGTTCTSQAVSGESAVNLINTNSSTSITINGVPGAGTWYLITCPGTTPSLIFEGAPAGQAAAPLAQPAALAQQALATMHLPAPRIGMSPPNTAEIVNFQDWLWVDSSMWHPISATASVGSVAATATATPQRVVYDMGDGNQVVCSSAGTPYNPATAPGAQSTSCSYRYANSSAGQPNNLYAASATIYWHVTWTAVGAPGGGDLGEIPGDTATTQVAVDEVQALNTASR
jgi:hypothetical protein